MHYSGKKDLKSLFKLFAADRAFLVQVVFYFVVSVALIAENQVLARLDHDCLSRVVADRTYHVFWQSINWSGVLFYFGGWQGANSRFCLFFWVRLYL